jgi:hypothetical protein
MDLRANLTFKLEISHWPGLQAKTPRLINRAISIERKLNDANVKPRSTKDQQTTDSSHSPHGYSTGFGRTFLPSTRMQNHAKLQSGVRARPNKALFTKGPTDENFHALQPRNLFIKRLIPRMRPRDGRRSTTSETSAKWSSLLMVYRMIALRQGKPAGTACNLINITL